MTTLTVRQARLQNELVREIQAAVSLTEAAIDALDSASGSYKAIAKIMIRLRHEFFGPDGRSPDLKGRSRGYRRAVRSAYIAAGAAGNGPIAKRLTAGVAYWTRKLLIDRYGEEKLREIGILPIGSFASVTSGARPKISSYRDAETCMATVVGLLNKLAADEYFSPSVDMVRSAARAVLLLQYRAGILVGKAGAA